MPPISPMKDGATGKTVKSATLTPLRTLELNEVYQLITANKRLITLTQAIREAALQGDDNNCRMLKQQTLPYVTPCGVFTRRRSDCLKLPSGPVLVFISPTGRGVKAFVPCPIGKDSTEAVRWAMNYVHCMYDAENTQPGKGVDTSGKDLVRACFLCHDPKALLRKVVNFEL